MKNKKEYDNAWYAKNKDRIREKKRAATKSIRIRNSQLVVDRLRKSGCIDCGESDFRVLEMDHIDPSKKKINISDMIRGNYSVENINSEMDKCVVRCANCHRRKTSIDFGWYKNVI